MDKPKWQEIAEGELGTSEVAGDVDNPRIVEYHATTSLKATDDETPWCSSFMNWIMRQAGLSGTGSAAARSWLTWGLPLEKPVAGCVVVLRRGSSPTAGHVGIYVEDSRNGLIRVLGGNQGDRVSYGLFRRSDVLGFRWPAA